MVLGGGPIRGGIGEAGICGRICGCGWAGPPAAGEDGAVEKVLEIGCPGGEPGMPEIGIPETGTLDTGMPVGGVGDTGRPGAPNCCWAGGALNCCCGGGPLNCCWGWGWGWEEV